MSLSMSVEFHGDHGDRFMVEVNVATISFGDITGFKAVVSVCLVCIGVPKKVFVSVCRLCFTVF